MQLLRELWHDRRGAFAPIAALVITVLLGFGALTIDFGYNYYMRNKLQLSADASALAGASQLQFLPDQTAMVSEALDYADRNMAFADYGNVLVAADVVAGNWDPDTRTFTPALDPLNAVMTTTRRQTASGNAVPAFLGGIAGFTDYDIWTSAIATYGQGDPIPPPGCIMATNTSEDKAFYVFGTATVTTADCNIEVASTAPCALHAHGTPTVSTFEGEDGGEAHPINVVGGYCENGPVSMNPPPTTCYGGTLDPDTNACIVPDPNPVQDPYRNNPDPCEDGLNCQVAPDDPCEAETYRAGDTVPAGMHCGGVYLTGNGDVTFEPGEHIIKDGPLDIGGNVAVHGDGVGFYLTGPGSVVNFKGTSGVTLSAMPTSANSPLAGFLFYEDQNKDPQESHTLRGTNGGAYQGIMYFSGDVQLKGTADGGLSEDDGDCTVLIADTVYFNGTTGLDADSSCESLGGAPEGVGELLVRLVE